MQVSFGRAVRMKTIVEPDSQAGKSFDSKTVTHFIGNTILGDYKNAICTKEQAEAMGNFLRAQLGDCEEGGAMCMRAIGDNNYLFTGNEARKAHEIICDTAIQHISVDNLKKYNKDLTQRFIEEKHKKVDKECNSKLVKLLENGTDGKPNSQVRVIVEKTDNPNLNKFNIFYSSTDRSNGNCINTDTSISV